MQKTKKTNPGEVSSKKDAAKPRRAKTTTDPNPVKKGAAEPRRTRDQAPSPKKTKGLSETKHDAVTRPAPRGATAKQLAKTPATKPRRIGTKMSRLLDLNPAPVKTATPAKTSTSKTPAKPLVADTLKSNHTYWLLYCRPGFEQDCAQEAIGQARVQRPVLAEQPETVADSGYAVISLNEQPLDYAGLIFARQLIRLHRMIDALPERDRLTPILTAIASLPGNFSALWLEVPDTNDGKTLTAFTRRFGPLLETALRETGRLIDDASLPRLHLFFPDKSSVLIGVSDPYNSSPSIMGIVRQSMPHDAPSRSTLKLAEAIEVFLDKSEQTRLLRSGMTAVDLGAAPGGWTWQMVKRGIRVTAVDNGPMKGVLEKHPLVEHLMQDGFKFAPRKAVDWLICDMVEKPSKVAELIGNWFASGWCKHAIFNLKLPMKQRVPALDSALSGIRSRLDMEAIGYRMLAKQLYHDREEITVFLTKTKNR
jgi:23S rRNA (cytidine2498-2'-O)-methyltransferase